MRAVVVIAISCLLWVEPAMTQDLIFRDGLENASTSSWSHDNTLCPTFFGGRILSSHCYTRLSNPGSWLNSQRLCRQWAPGGQLVSVETAPEWAQILLGLEAQDSDAWLGLSRGQGGTCPGTWAWESGSNLTFSDWHPGAPDEASCLACVATLDVLENRWDDLPCDLAGGISEAICEVDLDSVRIVGKNGGRLVFPDGFILDVPADAVEQDTAIGLRSIDCTDIDIFLNSRPLNSHDKVCLAAFEISPPDLTFANPARLTLPYADRRAGQIPVLLEIFPEDPDYAYRPTDLLHAPATESLELQVAAAGQYAVAELGRSPSPPPTQASSDKTVELPCEERRIHVQSDFVDLDVTYNDVECTLVFDSVKVTFLDCAGAPEFEHEMAESVGCSDETYFLGRICGHGVSGDECFADPQPVVYVPGEDSVRLHNWMQAIDPDQGHRRLFTANIDHATYQWQSLDYSMGKFPDPSTGLLQTEECPTETCRFGVQALNRYVSSPLPKGTVEVVSTIFDVEWSYSWSNETTCTLSEREMSLSGFERRTGDWDGTAVFAIPDYNLSETLSWRLEGAIEYFREADVTVQCDGYGAGWKEIDRQNWNSNAPCIKEDFALYIYPNEEDAEFWACMPPVNDHYQFRSGATCDGALHLERTLVRTGSVPCLFPVKVDLSRTSFGVFEANETLLLEPICSNPVFTGQCPGKFPVSVSVRAVYRQPIP
jgi:hypothetical protein